MTSVPGHAAEWQVQATSPLRSLREHRNVAIAFGLFACLVIVGSTTIDGFASLLSLRAMLVLGSFLGVAAIGQTLCALVGGLDLSIPFLIGSANIGTLWLIGKGLPSPAAILIVLALGTIIGLLNGTLGRLVRVHSLVVTLGVGFAVAGATQIVTSIGSSFAGNVYGETPAWLLNVSSVSGTTFGVGVPPVFVIWLVAALAVLGALRFTLFGRHVYAYGGNRLAAERALVPTRRTWLSVFALSGLCSAGAGVLLLGFTGGGFVGAGDPYFFTTIAAVVVGGTSLLGGQGGYGRTILGVAVLTVLVQVLAGYGLSTFAQESVMGALIVGMVALYAREAHPRTRV